MKRRSPWSAMILRCLGCGGLVDCPPGLLHRATAEHLTGCHRRGTGLNLVGLDAELRLVA